MDKLWIYNSGKNRIRTTCSDGWEHYNFQESKWVCGKDRELNVSDIKRGVRYTPNRMISKKDYRDLIINRR